MENTSNTPLRRFFILIGRSGGGKDTQAKLLQTYLENKGYAKVQHITTGGGFREFVERDEYVAKLSHIANHTGGLQPEFLAVWNWANIFINTLTGDETIILDGAPRKPFEVHVLHSAIAFLGYTDPVVIYLDVPESVCKAQLLGRGRDDDVNEETVNRRMGWFETEVLPTFNVYLSDPRYKVIHVNGHQSQEEVHSELILKLESK